MELKLFNEEYQYIDTVDTYSSLIWTDRYSRYGDFQLTVPATEEYKSIRKFNSYFANDESDRMMIIEGVEENASAVDGLTLTITGRSLESILERRIIWNQTVISGNLQNAIKKLLNNEIINPKNASRRIDNFIFKENTDRAVTSITISETQFTGDNLYETIVSLCEKNGLGFKITLNDNNQFQFELICGTDHSYNQEMNPFVVFSKNYDNIESSKFIKNTKTYKNVALIAGEGEGSARFMATVGNTAGLSRRELFVDARDISKTVDNTTLSDSAYTIQLQERGKANLSENIITEAFEGNVDTEIMYIYGKDYDIGDIVQIVSEYGMESATRVNEVIRSQSGDEHTTVPTFKALTEVE